MKSKLSCKKHILCGVSLDEIACCYRKHALYTGTEPADMPRNSEASWLHENSIAAAILLSVLSWSAARHYNDFQTFNFINVIKFIFITVSDNLIMIMINVNDHHQQ